MMQRSGRALLAAAALGLGACDSAQPPPGEYAAGEPTGPNPTVKGRAEYEALCANCHREGKHGAPVTGDASAWSGRSRLWMAVLSEHVKSGYFQMPARGGEETLSDAAIEAATEYMLSQTFTDLPRDQ